MGLKVLIATNKPFAAEAVQNIHKIINNADYDLVLLEKYTDKEQLIKAIADVDAAIIRSDIFDKKIFEAAKNLKIVVRAGAGYDNIDLDTATLHNVCVMNTPGQNANAVAELVFGMAIYAIRNFFNGTSGTELKDKKIGIHAYGNVGRNVARIAKGFNMEVFAYDPYLPAEILAKDGVKPVKDLDTLYSTCQFISLHIPATNETKSSINYSLLSKMPKNAILINTARKEIINEGDILKMLEERPDFKYLTDIQPANNEELVEKFSNRYFATPKKSGAQTAEANTNAGIAAANQIVDYLKNGNEKFRLNKKN